MWWRMPRDGRRAAAAALMVAALVACEHANPTELLHEQVAAVLLDTESDTLALNGAADLTAVAVGTAGDTLSARVIWRVVGEAALDTSSVGAVHHAHVTGTACGDVLVIAASADGTHADSAQVTVRCPGGGATFGHVALVMLENHDYASVIGSASMPYLNGLATQYGQASQYYADTHPSIGNYFMLATGQVVTNNDSYATVVDVDNVVRQLVASGKTWRSYAEDLPSVGYTGPDAGNYARKHNVFALLSDVVNSTTQVNNLVPFTQFATDLANGTLPDFANIVPNLCNDAHDCDLGTADAWLLANIAPLIASPTFQHDGLLIITFDESSSDNTYGGGRVAWVVVSPKARHGYTSNTVYQHASTLRLILKALGVTQYPGAAATAPDMDEFFVP